MGLFSKIVGDMKNTANAKKDQVLETQGLDVVFQTPECYCAPTTDINAFLSETSDWLVQRLDEGKSLPFEPFEPEVVSISIEDLKEMCNKFCSNN